MTKVVNINKLDWLPFEGPGKFGVERKHLTPGADTCNLGCSLYRLAPGQSPCPAHFHYANDEAILVLKGSLTLTVAGTSHQLDQGDYVTLPAGTGEAHQLTNTSEQIAEYLCMSTMEKTDVVYYPNSGKFGVFGGVAPGGTPTTASQKVWLKNDDVDYWLDEDG